MNRRFSTITTGLFALVTLALSAFPAAAQTPEVKEKPPMYSFIANWQVNRAHWPDMDTAFAPVNDTLQKALADGTIVGYGRDTNLVHQPDRETHDVWWSAMSMAGLIKTLDRIHAANDSSAAVLNDAKHWDDVFVSRYYNWKPGPYKAAYTHVGVYRLKEGAPDDALENISQHLVVPVLEKLLADGTIEEYEIDTMAIHTAAPGMFAIVALTPTPEGIDTLQAAIRASVKEHPLGIAGFDADTDSSAHRDELLKSEGVYKYPGNRWAKHSQGRPTLSAFLAERVGRHELR